MKIDTVDDATASDLKFIKYSQNPKTQPSNFKLISRARRSMTGPETSARRASRKELWLNFLEV